MELTPDIWCHTAKARLNTGAMLNYPSNIVISVLNAIHTDFF